MSEWILAVVTGTQALLFALTFYHERRARRWAIDAERECDYTFAAADVAADAARHVERLTAQRCGRRWAGEPNASPRAGLPR